MFRPTLGCTCALILAGCGLQKLPPDYADARDTSFYGVPAQMDVPSAVDRIGRQNQYFLTLAGRLVEKQPPGTEGQIWPILPPDSPGGLDWPSVTRRGLADIDAVCTNYFKRLDDYADYRKSLRDSTGIVGSATTTLMAALDAATGGIAIVSGLFGVSQGLMDSTSQAALYSIDATKLYNLYYKAASAYRQSRKPPVEQISSAGEAADMLGGYVALCTPVVLKGLISESIERVQIGSTAEGRIGILTANKSSVLEQLDVGQPVPTTPAPAQPQQITGALSDTERLLDRRQGERIQKVLCVPADGNFGTQTRTGIALYRRHHHPGAAAAELTAPLSLKEATDLLAATPCNDAMGYENVWESLQFGTADSIRELQRDLDEQLADRTVSLTGRFDPETRAAIAEVNRRLALPAGDQATPELSEKLAH